MYTGLKNFQRSGALYGWLERMADPHECYNIKLWYFKLHTDKDFHILDINNNSSGIQLYTFIILLKVRSDSADGTKWLIWWSLRTLPTVRSDQFGYGTKCPEGTKCPGYEVAKVRSVRHPMIWLMSMNDKQYFK